MCIENKFTPCAVHLQTIFGLASLHNGAVVKLLILRK